MKLTFFFLSVVVALLSTSFSKHYKYTVPPEPVPLAMCYVGATDIDALPEFKNTKAYLQSLTEPTYIRKDISRMDANDSVVIALKKAITVMKKRPASDPTSWSYQANIHGTTETKLLPLWNSCTHKSDFFLSWHRMYLYFFERIMRKASGDPSFALPYWDWSKIDGESIPKVFREPKNRNSNPLYLEGRDEKMNLGGLLAKAIVQNDVASTMKSQFLLSSQSGDAISFNKSLEAVHGKIHVMVGGNAGLMKSIQTAALDPIFWMHHCNIDHLWEKWMIEKNPELPDTKDPWFNQKFVFFDENGKRVTMSGKDVINIAKQLNYKYEGVPIKATDSPKPITRTRMVFEQPLIVASTKSVSLSADKNIFMLSPTITGMPDREKQFNLVFEKIKLKGWADGVFELYLNQNVESTPDPSQNNYVGSVDFFGLTEIETKAGHTDTQVFDATEAIRAYLAQNNRFENLKVMIYHRSPELNGVSEPQTLSVSATVGVVKLVQY